MQIASSARRHGVSDDDIEHAYRNHVAGFVVDDDMTMLVGPATDGTLLEIGVARRDDVSCIVHAMPARLKFLR